MKTNIIRTILSFIIAVGNVFSYAATSTSAVGRIPANFSTNSMGAALYTVPIQCPEGVNEMQPKISLSYNSQAGNGIAGWGWTISGVSSIARIKRTSYYDDTNKEITWTAADSLALDGVRLMPSIRYADSINYYLENNPTILVRAYGIRNNNSPTHFKVFTKSGLTMTYGDPGNLSSHLLMYDNAAQGSGVVKAGWNLVRVEDAHGNFMKMEYLNVMGSYRGNVIRKITYGGNRAKRTEGHLTVHFDYEGREDKVQNFISGKEVLMQLRLTKITTKVDDVVQKNYRISYQQGKITRLEKITLFDQSTQLYDPLIFSYGESNTGGSNIDISHIKNKDSSTEKEKRVGLIAIDRNGSGYSQLGDIFYESRDFSKTFGYGSCYIDMHEKKYNWINSSRSAIAVNMGNIPRAIPGLFADFNGNGSADKVNFYFETNVLGQKLMVRIEDQLVLLPLCDSPLRIINNTPFIATGTYFGNPLAGALIVYDQPEELSNKTYKYSYDMVMSNLTSGNVGTYTHSNMFFVVPKKITYATTIKMGSINYYDDLFLLLEDGSARILKNNQSGAFCFTSTNLLKDTGLKISKDDLFSFGDMNVDGLTDIIYRKGIATWNIAFNKGNGEFLTKSLPNFYCDKNGFEDECDYIAIVDINNDNIPDIVVGDELRSDLTFWRFYLNDGTATFTTYSGEQSPERSSYSCLADFHGNGTISWVHTSMNGKVLITDFGYGRYKNLLTKVENPVSPPLEIKYKPQAECKFMDGKDPVHAYTTPRKYLEIGYLPFKTSMMPIVSESSEGKAFVKYNYGTALLNWYHRGYAGFRFYQEYDSTHNVRTDVVTRMYRHENNYSSGNKYNLIMPYDTKKYLGRSSTTPFAQEFSIYTIKNLGGKRFTMWESEYSKSDNISNSFHNEVRVCDVFNNIIKLTVGIGSRKTITETTYEKNYAWCLNVPKEEKITEQFDSETLVKVRTYKYYLKGIPREYNTDFGTDKNITIKNVSFDAFGHPTCVERSAPDQYTRRSYTVYSACGRFLIKNTDELGQVTSYKWDEKRGLLLNDSTRMGITKYGYNNFGELTTTNYPDGRIASQSIKWGASMVCHGSPGAKYTIISSVSGGANTYTLYNAYGQEIAHRTRGVNLRGIYTYSEYQEKDGKLLKVSKPTFNIIPTEKDWAEIYEYDAYGRISKVTTPSGIVATTYSRKNENDGIYLYKTVTAPDSEIKTKYSETGQLVQSTVNDKSVLFTHTLGGRVKTATPEGGGTLVTFQYDRNGNRTQITDPNSSTVYSEYDVWGNLIKESQYIHDNSGGNITTEYAYGGNGRLSQKR